MAAIDVIIILVVTAIGNYRATPMNDVESESSRDVRTQLIDDLIFLHINDDIIGGNFGTNSTLARTQIGSETHFSHSRNHFLMES